MFEACHFLKPAADPFVQLAFSQSVLPSRLLQDDSCDVCEHGFRAVPRRLGVSIESVGEVLERLQ